MVKVPTAPGTVAIVGAGTIGLSWAVLFARHGWNVRVTDPRPDLADAVAGGLRHFAPEQADALSRRVHTTADLADATRDVDVVQENGPEDVQVKRRLFTEVVAAAPLTALLASSTSGIQPTDIAADLDRGAAARLLVAHPFNPPHLLPLVELVAGSRTAPHTLDRAEQLYRSLGKTPVRVRKEMPGFVANRLQSALFREAVNLVLEGVVTPAELDTVVTGSLGPRWATGGPFLSYHLGGGPGGIRHFLRHLGPGMARRWKNLGKPDLTETVIDRLVTATEAAYADRDYADLARERDRAVAAVLATREGAPR